MRLASKLTNGPFLPADRRLFQPWNCDTLICATSWPAGAPLSLAGQLRGLSAHRQLEGVESTEKLLYQLGIFEAYLSFMVVTI